MSRLSSEAPTRRPSKDDFQTITIKDADEKPVTKPMLKKYSYSFWAPEIQHLRALYFKITAMSVILLIIVVWACLPVYWGSLWKAPVLTKNLRAWVINRDGDFIGNTLTSAIMNTTTSGAKNVLGWQQLDPSSFATDEDVGNAVVDERAWLAVVITEGATRKLAQARENGDASYNPMNAVSVYYTQGRNEVATGSYILPITNALLIRALGEISAQSTAEYIASISGNQTALGFVARAPQTISNAAYFQLFNLRPYTSQVASAVTLVGFIYATILSFFITMSGAGAREIIGPYLKMSTYIRLRLIMPILLYIPLSLIYSMISLPFHLPFDGKYSYAGGFFLFWCLMFAGMLALGLATEAALTLLTPRFIPFFLIPLIVVNVSVTVVPNEIQPWFYKYGLGFPVANMSQAVRTIIFDTKNHLGRNFGVIIAWAVLSLITVPLLTFIMRRKEMIAAAQDALPDEREEEIREKQQRIDFGAGTSAQMSPGEAREVEAAEQFDRAV